MAKKAVSVLLEMEDYEKLQKLSKIEKRTLASLIRFLIIEKYEALINQNQLKEDFRA